MSKRALPGSTGYAPVIGAEFPIAEQPDAIWAKDADGNPLPWGKPNFDKPGVAEAVERLAFDGHCAARPSGGGLSTILHMAKVNKFEDEIKERK